MNSEWALNAHSRLQKRVGDGGKPTNPNALVLEAWAEGYMIGSLIILSCITLANMRRGVLLHKLILLELVLGYWQGFFILFNPPIYAWWLSVAAIFLNASWSLHNVIAWMKIKPFLSRMWSIIFISTVILVQPYWVVEIYANFTYFHNINNLFLRTRPWEALCRDPWWVATTIFLLYNIKTKYDLTVTQIIKISPRFAVMLGAMVLSIIFIILDVLSVTSVLKASLPIGINPFWKLSFVFKCLTDAVVLDDFKTALDRLRAFKISRLGSFAIDPADSRSRKHEADVAQANDWMERLGSGQDAALSDDHQAPPFESPDGDYIQSPWDQPSKGAANKSNRDSQPNSHHLEYDAGPLDERTRAASRDRDSEENEVEPAELSRRSKHGQAGDDTDVEAQRDSSDAHILKHTDGSISEKDALDVDTDEDDDFEHQTQVEYAEAIRSMAAGSNVARGAERRVGSMPGYHKKFPPAE